MNHQSVSFMHSGDERMASYRYRAAEPAKWLSASMNNPMADILIFSKPVQTDVEIAKQALRDGKTVIVDICDAHFENPLYRQMVKLASLVTASSQWMVDMIHEDFGIHAKFIAEPYEYGQREPHCKGDSLLWFGNAQNYDSLARVMHHCGNHPLHVVSNRDGATPWSPENMASAFRDADIVILPETAPYKSANRAVESIRQGCFVVAEPHPAINQFPGIWIGNIREGIQWAQQNPQLANSKTKIAQEFVSTKFSPKILASAWKSAIQTAQYCSVSARGELTGTDG